MWVPLLKNSLSNLVESKTYFRSPYRIYFGRRVGDKVALCCCVHMQNILSAYLLGGDGAPFRFWLGEGSGSSVVVFGETGAIWPDRV